MGRDYQPTFALGSSSPYESVDDYPEGFKHGGGVDFEDDWDPPETPASNTSRNTPASFGRERHPSIVVAPVVTNNPTIHRCESGDGVRYVISIETRDVPETLLDADMAGEPVWVGIFGTRKGDADHVEAEIRDIRARRGGGAAIVLALPMGENGTLYRRAATGCLVCRGGPA